MSNTLSVHFFQRLAGPSGAYFMEYGSLEALLQEAILHSFFARQNASRAVRGKPSVSLSHDAAYRYTKGRLPNKVLRHYAVSGGYTYALTDMQLLTALPGRITRLQNIQDNIHRWICSADLPEEDVQALNSHYCPHQATRENISIYLAHVMVYVMTAA